MSGIEHEHLTREMLEKYFETTPIDQVSRMLLHLLAVCPECRKVGGTIFAAYTAGAIGIRFSSVEVDLFASRSMAWDLWKTLESLSFEEQLRLVEEREEYRSWGLVELLARVSSAEGPKDASRAIDLASLAVEVAG